MARRLAVAIWTLSALAASIAPAAAQQKLQIQVRDFRSGQAVESMVQSRTRRDWDNIRETNAGQLSIPFSCKDGMQIRAAPIDANYYPSKDYACTTVPRPLRVRRR